MCKIFFNNHSNVVKKEIKFILFCHLQDFATVTSGELQSKAESEVTVFLTCARILCDLLDFSCLGHRSVGRRRNGRRNGMYTWRSVTIQKNVLKDAFCGWFIWGL